MPFDWFTIAAQIINFSVLLWLLRRFLYHPILDGLDARELRLKNILEEANTKNADAEQRQKNCQLKEAQLQQQRASILEKAETDAKEQRIKLFDDAQETADEMLRKRLEALQNVLINLKHEVLSKNIDEVYATAAKILDDLAGVKLEQAIVDKFLMQLKTLKGKEYDAFLDAMEGNSKLVVRSAFPLTDALKNEIEHTLNSLLSKHKQATIELNFLRVPQLMAGLELSVGGWKLAWSIHYHLKALENRVNEIIQLAPLNKNSESASIGEKSASTIEQ